MLLTDDKSESAISFIFCDMMFVREVFDVLRERKIVDSLTLFGVRFLPQKFKSHTISFPIFNFA